MPFIIPTIYTAVDRMSATAAKIGAANTAMGVSTTVAAAKMERSLNKVNASAMAVGTTTAAVGLAILVPLGLATHAAMDFEKQMSNVSTLVDTATESMSAMGDQVLNISKRVPVAINDLTQSLYYIRSAGVDAADAMNVLETSGQLAVAGLSTATESAKAITSAMVSFKAQGLTSTQIANSFFLTVKEGKTKMEDLNASFGDNAPLVASAGIKLQEFNALTATMTNAGMTASEAQNSLRMAVLGLIKPTTDMNTIFQKLNVTTGEELIQRMGGLDSALDAVKASAQGTGIEMAHLFNRTGLTSFTVLTQLLSDQAKANIAQQSAGTPALMEAFNKQSATAAANWQLMKNNLEIAGIKIGTLLLPAVISLTNAIISIVDPIAKWAENNKKLSGFIITTVAALGLLSLTISISSFLIGGITKAVWLWQAAMTAWNFISGFVLFKLGLLNDGIILNATATKGATFAMNGFNSTLSVTLGFITAIALGLYEVNKLMNEWSAKNPLQKEIAHKNSWFNTRATPIYDSLVKHGFTPDQIEQQANDSQTYTGVGKAATTSSQNVNHHFTIDLKSDGKVVKTINSGDLTPSMSSTSDNYSND